MAKPKIDMEVAGRNTHWFLLVKRPRFTAESPDVDDEVMKHPKSVM